MEVEWHVLPIAPSGEPALAIKLRQKLFSHKTKRLNCYIGKENWRRKLKKLVDISSQKC